ncbi:MAG: hypothetical protein AAF548_04620 [Actinomycetota bacterium]
MRSSRRLVFAVLAALALFAAACGDDGDSVDQPGVESPEDDATTTSTTTTVPGTTAPIPDDAEALVDLQISSVTFGDDGFVTIVNNGADEVDLDGIFLCQFPTYQPIAGLVDGGVLAAGASADIAAAEWGGLLRDTGEAGLYNGQGYTDPDSILAYVQWGEGGHERASVAADAGIWPSADDFVTPDPEFPNIESGGDPADPANWS